MSAFDPETFMQTEIAGSLDTKMIPVPEGQYTARIEKVDARKIKPRDGGEERLVVDITWEIDDQDSSVQQVTQREKNTVRQSLFLDLTSEGGLDMGKGKNIQLGRLREALDQNGSGHWSFAMLQGQYAMIFVKQTHDNDKDETYANVVKVAPLN